MAIITDKTSINKKKAV